MAEKSKGQEMMEALSYTKKNVFENADKEKIKKITGLDLREFDHAIIFKVALMVKKYLESRDRDEI